MRLHRFLGALAAAASFAHAAIPPSEQAVAVEFYHAGFDHYFITAEPREIDDLDTGVHAGWTRTGYRFAVMRAGSAYPGTSPVCRFFSEKFSSHFYSSKPSECDDVRERFADTWSFEAAEVFRAFPVDPVTGLCPADTTPVYRLYNNRADANHRYTDQLSVFAEMKDKGYIPEGDGNPALPVAFCTPAPAVVPPPGPVPTCTVSATNTMPLLGTSITLNATCTPAATSYAWLECDYYVPSICNPMPCSSASPACTVTSFVTAYTRYTVAGSNAAGAGERGEVQVEWRTGATGYTGGFCGQYPRAKLITIPWGDYRRYTTVEHGGWPADMILVVEIAVPSAPLAYATPGHTSLAEYEGPPAVRQMTLSRTACDFRELDPSGASGPFASTSGTVVQINWNVGAAPVGLVPGQTYYFNFRNLACGQLTCEASTSTNWPL